MLLSIIGHITARSNRACIAVVLLLATTLAIPASAQNPPTRPDSVHKLGDLGVTVKHVQAVGADTGRQPAIQKITLPASASITAPEVQRTVNVVDAEDAVKYLPSVFLRKRNYGDNQATLETRVWGVSSSARTLVFADGALLSALVANNNNIGAPRWGLVSPNQIERIDVMYGPFSAAYAGNSIGGVMEITTRMPQVLQGTIGQTVAVQHFGLYGTDRSYATSQTTADFGDRLGKFSFWLSGNFQQSESQPLSFVTSSTFPSGTTGGYDNQNKLGATANILGASGLLRTGMTDGTARLAYDLAPDVRLTYSLGFWQNRQSSFDQSYLEASGAPTFAGQSGFASGFGTLLEQHTSQSVTLRNSTGGNWDYEAVGTLYRFNTDQQRLPGSASKDGTSFGTAGKIALLDGTGWGTADIKAAYHPGGEHAANTLAFGAHYDHYRLYNPTYATTDWRDGDPGAVLTEGDGKTSTDAAWLQDGWHMTPQFLLTVGGRLEHFHAYDGYNVNGSTVVNQPDLNQTRFSPKGSLAWNPSDPWTVTFSLAKAYRFATAAELYQLVSTGTTYTSPSPTLKPDNDLSAELRVDRRIGERSTVRLSLFQDQVYDAITSEYLPLAPGSSTLYSYVSNVDHVRARGVEAAMQLHGVVAPRFDLSGSVTYVDARTLALTGQASPTAPAGSAIGKRLPGIPDWRWSVLGTYHIGDGVSASLAARYSGAVFTTLDNSDTNPDTYQGFASWLVADARLDAPVGQHWNASLGVDNLFNRKFFFYHPFPQRTAVGGLKYVF